MKFDMQHLQYLYNVQVIVFKLFFFSQLANVPITFVFYCFKATKDKIGSILIDYYKNRYTDKPPNVTNVLMRHLLSKTS